MYATLEQLRLLLPNNITIGDNNLGTPYSPTNLAYPGMPAPVPGLPQNKDKLTVTEARRYIHLATQEVDARLRAFYLVPLRRIKSFETKIKGNVVAGANVVVQVHDSGPFSEFETVRIQDENNSELVTVSSIPSANQLVMSNVINSYSEGKYSLISIVEYPDPIPSICARLAVSYIYDEFFSAEQAPSASEYGKEQRKIAFAGIDSILDGTVKLFGQEHTGRRFIRGSLFDAYRSPVKDFTYGRDK